MPKPATSPILLDDCKIINISFLKKHDYLIEGSLKSDTITWRRNGQPTGRINILCSLIKFKEYIELSYVCNGTEIKYRVYLISLNLNLGKGKVWYFLCPFTNKLCRKLYLVGDYFKHLTAFVGTMYETQTKTKKDRVIDKHFGSYFELDEIKGELYQKYFKKTYAGKPTKRYLKLYRKLQYTNRITSEDITRAIMN